MQLTFGVSGHYVDSQLLFAYRAQCVEHCAVAVYRDQTIRLCCHESMLRGSVTGEDRESAGGSVGHTADAPASMHPKLSRPQAGCLHWVVSDIRCDLARAVQLRARLRHRHRVKGFGGVDVHIAARVCSSAAAWATPGMSSSSCATTFGRSDENDAPPTARHTGIFAVAMEFSAV